MTATKTRSLVAVTPGGEITKDMIAGFYSWFSFRENLIPLTRVRKAFKDAGLDVDRLPKERRPEHVAQEAMRLIERVEQNGHRTEIRVEKVDRTDTFLVYQVTKHVQHKETQVIEHPKALRVLFNHKTEEFDYQPLDGASMEEVQQLADAITANYEANGTKMPGRTLRTIVRHYLEAAGAESMSEGGGGIYFLPTTNPISPSNKLHAHHGDSIDGETLLAQIEQALVETKAADFHSHACVNDEGERAYLKRKFQENCAEDLKEFRDEVMGLLGAKEDRKRSFRTDLRERLVGRRAQINERRAQFAAILGDTLEELDRDMALADKALVKFLNEADA